MTIEAISGRDQVRRFIFEARPVRGHWVHLEQAWRELRAHTNYPQCVATLLGESVAAAVLLAATLKFRGTLTLQLQGQGAVSLLVAQCTHDFRLRAVARFDAEALAELEAESSAARFRRLAGRDARLTVTIEAEEKGSRYQGIVPLDGANMARSLEAYFASSEQLPTRVVLAADEHAVAGLLVQKLPSDAEKTAEESIEAWEQAEQGIARLPGGTLLGAAVEPLLLRVFPGQDLRLFRGSAVRFECRCSTGRVASVLRALGAAELHEILREQGAVTVTCEFCHRPYRFDSSEIEALLGGQTAAGDGATLH
jgi:molecular chaperone Hsp33